MFGALPIPNGAKLDSTDTFSLPRSDILLFTVIVQLGKSIFYSSTDSSHFVCSIPSRNAPSFSIRDTLDFFLLVSVFFLLPVMDISPSFLAAGFFFIRIYISVVTIVFFLFFSTYPLFFSPKVLPMFVLLINIKNNYITPQLNTNHIYNRYLPSSSVLAIGGWNFQFCCRFQHALQHQFSYISIVYISHSSYIFGNIIYLKNSS